MAFSDGDTFSLPSEVVVQRQGDDVRYILPRHRIGRLRWLGIVPLTAGLAISCWHISAYESGLPLLFALFFLGISLPVIVPLVALGLLMLAGHSEITVRGTTLRATEAVGPLRWTRRRSIGRISRFTVFTTDPEGKQGPEHRDSPALIAEGVGIRRLWLMIGYPRDWTVQIAEQLSARCSAALQFSSGDAASSRSQSMGAALLDAVDAVEPQHPSISHNENSGDLLRPPKNSTITMVDRADGATLTMPWGGSLGLLIVAGVLLLMDGFALALMLAGQKVSGNLAHPLPMALMALAAVGMLLRVWQVRRRQVTFEVRSGTLTVTQTDPLVRHQWQWQREQLLGIGRIWENSDRKDSAMLEIRTKEGGSMRLLRRQDPIEVEWLVQVLLHKLR